MGSSCARSAGLSHWRGILITLAWMAFAWMLEHQSHAAGPVRRARPPKFGQEVEGVFFPDARTKLVGSRPQTVSSAGPLTKGAPSPEPPNSRPAKGGWSRWISAEAIEDEIKTQQITLAEAVRSAAKFKSGDYQRARVSFSILTTMFAAAAETDEPVRWQRDAAAFRDLMSRASANCKVGTDASYKEAKSCLDDLQNLVRGSAPALKKPTAEITWPQLTDRSPLMKRLEQSQQQALAPWTASSKEFVRRAQQLAHEAQVVAVLAEVIQGEGYEYADDETYREYATEMQEAAFAARTAAEQKDYVGARQAVSQIGKACSNCHEGYRN